MIDSVLRPRLAAAVLFTTCLGLLLLAKHLDSPGEAAAHQMAGQRISRLSAYGFPGCGFKQVTGLPCATCGMTRSFAAMAEGDLAGAVAIQPAGAALCLLAAVGVLVGGWALVTAMPLGPVFGAVLRPGTVIPAAAVVLVVWGLNVARQWMGYIEL